jgi:hypothetical protein
MCKARLPRWSSHLAVVVMEFEPIPLAAMSESSISSLLFLEVHYRRRKRLKKNQKNLPSILFFE